MKGRTTIRLQKFWLYLLFSVKTGQVYLGSTSDLQRRFREHNSPDNRGWTRRGQPWRLLAVRCYLDRDSAYLAERRMKQSRFEKRNWIRAERRRLQTLCQRHGIPHPLA